MPGRRAAPRTTIVSDLGELRALDAVGAVAFPCVVKPADGAGSADVTVVTGHEGLEPAWHAALATRAMYGMPRDQRVLVQEHICGSEFSVESVTQHGVTTHLCITRKHTTNGIHRVELGHALPARLPAAAEQALLDQAGRAIAAVGVRNGATHTEHFGRIDHLFAQAPNEAWERRSCGDGAKGPRVYHWAALQITSIEDFDGEMPTH
ncbi:ATP-grasp domain-containing protein [Streptomyces sp. NPDC101152]|uniref:ATP-grasp domain-containing protein n=1 Tax=Streptomyces sp. NPDC101152 TaxID=3366116 RepID=UPI0037FF279D